MDTTVLLLLLIMLLGGEDANRNLRSFLSFYRENRDIVAALAGNPSAREKEPAKESPSPSAQKENRPKDRVGSVNILEEYLKRTV